MFRYELSSSSASCMSPEMTLGKASLDMVKIEEDADNIRERLQYAESRLKHLSRNSIRESSCRNSKVSKSPIKCLSPALRKTKLQSPIDMHFQQINQRLQNLRLYYVESESTKEVQYEKKWTELIYHFEEQTLTHNREMIRMEAALKGMEENLAMQIRVLETRHAQHIARLEFEHQNQLYILRESHEQSLRGLQLNSQAHYLKEQFITEIELLQQTLESERQVNQKMRQGERAHISEICRLQKEIELLRVGNSHQILKLSTLIASEQFLKQKLIQYQQKNSELESIILQNSKTIQEFRSFVKTLGQIISNYQDELSNTIRKSLSINYKRIGELLVPVYLNENKPSQESVKSDTQKLLSLISDDKQNLPSNNHNRAIAKRKSKSSKTVSCDGDLLMMIVLQAQQVQSLLN